MTLKDVEKAVSERGTPFSYDKLWDDTDSLVLHEKSMDVEIITTRDGFEFMCIPHDSGWATNSMFYAKDLDELMRMIYGEGQKEA